VLLSLHPCNVCLFVENLAFGSPFEVSSVSPYRRRHAAKVVDGIVAAIECFKTDVGKGQWFMVDLLSEYQLECVYVYSVGKFLLNITSYS